MPELLPALFAALAARAPEKTAGWRLDSPVPHADLITRVRAWTALARRTGGANIALFHDDSLEFAAALLGAWQAGKTVWLAADTLPATCAVLAPSVDAFFGVHPASMMPQSPADDDDCGQAWHAPAADFAALVIHTSGSTGAPKAIPKRLAQLTDEVAALEQQFGAQVDGAEVLATVSHQHIYGLLFRILWPLAAGRAIHAHTVEHPETLAAALARRPCMLIASPAHLKRLPEHLDWRGAAAQLTAVFSSGGELTFDAARHARALLGQSALEVYGSSETGGIAWRRQGGAAPDAAWSPMPCVEWRLAGGLLEVNSPFAAPGSWLQMADLAEDAGAKRFMLRGRADRIVKIEQKRVSLEALEAALTASPLVHEARVIACPAAAGADALARETLAAFVVLTEAGRLLLASDDKAAMNQRLRAVLAATAEAVVLPRRWRYLDSLPVNAQGKISQAALLAVLALSALPAPRERPRLPQVAVLEQSAEKVLLALTVPPDLLYFDGHFAVAPVLPGVVQVDWAILFGRGHFDIAGEFAGMQALKFQQMIRPGRPLRLELNWEAIKYHLQFRYVSDAGPHASGRILFAPVIAVATPIKDVC
jgi:acyl-CoA synthetase (AMP-forming)/AMP-acid ligase II/3-hydroxymyristoyl/3-hydroxydecanoyl-(acyl carrier protein) dehydratase